MNEKDLLEEFKKILNELQNITKPINEFADNNIKKPIDDLFK
tara:strand:+ start:1654 stop:1779 length:126 start_codon:yes stop_codon:yes gene_type:complete